ncbi:hypothetical protein AO070_00365 [Pseudomonas syringae pv. syringae PD2766]|nr:hypothetical protein AO070_00365 [Pseudomonas syringae pv. syringae PD2766]
MLQDFMAYHAPGALRLAVTAEPHTGSRLLFNIVFTSAKCGRANELRREIKSVQALCVCDFTPVKTQCCKNVLWIIVYRSKQCTRWPLWLASSLFPITKCPDCDINVLGKGCLGKTCRLSDFFDLNGIDMEFTRGLALTAIYLVHLGHALYKTIKEIFFHYFHPLLIARS